MDWSPINWKIAGNPINWLIVLSVVLVAGFAVDRIVIYVGQQRSTSNT